jgi:hypothetical protein
MTEDMYLAQGKLGYLMVIRNVCRRRKTKRKSVESRGSQAGPSSSTTHQSSSFSNISRGM